MKFPVQVDLNGVPQVPIHLIYRAEGEECWRLACMPEVQPLHADRTRGIPWLRSEDPRAVTCANCLHTPEYQKALEVVNTYAHR